MRKWRIGLGLAVALGAASPAQAPLYTPARLEQLTAPVALYPDPVLALVAQSLESPDQLEELQGILRQRQAVSCAALADYVNRRPWDASVKGLMDFPSVMDELNWNPSWLRNLAAAWTGQRADVLATVQALRRDAVSAEMLTTGPQQRIEAPADGPVRIHPTDLAAISVPIYLPWAMYGEHEIAPMFLLLPPAVLDRGRIRTSSWCGVLPGEYPWAAPAWDVDWTAARILYPVKPQS